VITYVIIEQLEYCNYLSEEERQRSSALRSVGRLGIGDLSRQSGTVGVSSFFKLALDWTRLYLDRN